jgi:excisionase family DNA binding protein
MIVIQVGRLAQKLGVHRNTVTNWIKSGKLLAAPTVGKRYLIDEGVLNRFCSEMGISKEMLGSWEEDETTAGPLAAPPAPLPEANGENRSAGPLGSVMVVGGGIAGIQAALDLADTGYFVHMIEKSAGIGGAMAQLDKTFPTNDCAM